MATFSIDNDRVTSGIQDLTYDQTSGTQSPPDGDEVNVTLDGATQLDGLAAGFKTFLAGLSLSTAQKNFAVDADAAVSNADFITVTADSGETFNDLKLIADSSTALTTITTLDGGSIYVHVDASGDFATLWTSSDDTGRIVGAIALTDETIDNTTTHTATAGVAMVFFEAVTQTDTTDNDESVSLSDVLKVGVDTAVSFNFEQLDAGNFLWAAVGDDGAAMLITGQDLNVKNSGSPSQIGNTVTGGADGSDTVNTSKASDTTIGINAQHFAPANDGDGSTAVFTFVSGLASLEAATPFYTGGNVKQIDYDDYVNVSSASIFISQVTGSGDTSMHLSLWEAGGGEGTAGVDGADHETGDLVPEEGYSGVDSYIGNEDADTHLKDDCPVNVASVEITRGATTYVFTGTGGSEDGLTVAIDGNDVTVTGALEGDSIKLIAENDPSIDEDGTFNRIDIQALEGGAAFDIGHIDLTSGGLTAADLGTHLFTDDDGPDLTPQPGGSLTPNDLQVDNDLSDSADSTDSSSYGILAGTDGQLSYKILGPADSTGDFQWTYDDSTGTAITGTYLGNNLYTLVLDPTDGSYDFTMIGTLPGGTLDLSPNEVIKAGSPDNPILEIGAANSTDFVRMTADSTVGNGNINESHGFVGCDNGNLDANESLTFTLHEEDGTPLTFEGIQIGTKSAQGGEYSWTAELAGGGTISSSENEVVGKNQPIIIDEDDLGGATIVSITIFKESGPATKIGIGGIHIIVPPDDVQLGFTVELQDGDSDPTTESFVVDIDADNDGNFDATVNSLSLINDHALI
jgi:hypothetical protein